MIDHSLGGRTAVVTGATSGIGAVVAQSLASKGAALILVARNGALAAAKLAELPPPASGRHRTVIADLSVLADMKRAATEIADGIPSLDILINNAGAMFQKRMVTLDGMEQTFALNHMSYFMLTLGLLKKLKASPQGRVVVTSSRLHAAYRLDFDDLQNESGYSAYKAYGRSKLCNILFARALARRLEGSKVTVNAVHPGYVATNIGADDRTLVGRLDRTFKFLALSPEAGARTTLHVATSEEGGQVSGGYFVKEKPARSSPAAEDMDAAKRLWSASERLGGL
jgi:NAD(P)-dependent dehydrogenase (short-subunit alcohol dehydrogenase family)